MSERNYTVQLGWYTLSVVDVTVKASSIKEACEKALAEDCGNSRTIYDCCTDTAVLDLARGVHDCAVDAPVSTRIKVPAEFIEPTYEYHPNLLKAAPALRNALEKIVAMELPDQKALDEAKAALAAAKGMDS